MYQLIKKCGVFLSFVCFCLFLLVCCLLVCLFCLFLVCFCLFVFVCLFLFVFRFFGVCDCSSLHQLRRQLLRVIGGGSPTPGERGWFTFVALRKNVHLLTVVAGGSSLKGVAHTPQGALRTIKSWCHLN